MRAIQLILVCAILAVLPLAAQQQQKQAPAPAPVTPEQRAAFEAIIRDYIMKNPGVVRDALQAAEEQEQQARSERSKTAIGKSQRDLMEDPSSPVGGNAKGDVTIVEFFDYRCGYCKRTEPILAAAIERDKNLRIVYKEFPILGNDSVMAARAALAAALQGKYAPFHTALMAASGSMNEASIRIIAEKVGADPVKLLADMQLPALNTIIDNNHKLAGTLEVQGTPAFIIGETLYPGALDNDSLSRLVTLERAKLQGAKGGGAVAK